MKVTYNENFYTNLLQALHALLPHHINAIQRGEGDFIIVDISPMSTSLTGDWKVGAMTKNAYYEEEQDED